MVCVSSEVVSNNGLQPPVREPAIIRVIFLNGGMQGRNENILSSTDKINAFQKKLIAAGNFEMFPSTPSNYPKLAQLILNHLDTLLINLDKYFLSISVDQYDRVRSPFVEFEPSEEQLTLIKEEFASVSSDRTLKLKHSELSLDAFWLLVEKEYPAIALKAVMGFKILRTGSLLYRTR